MADSGRQASKAEAPKEAKRTSLLDRARGRMAVGAAPAADSSGRAAELRTAPPAGSNGTLSTPRATGSSNPGSRKNSITRRLSAQNTDLRRFSISSIAHDINGRLFHKGRNKSESWRTSIDKWWNVEGLALSQEQYDEIRRVFMRFDSDNSGAIDASELGTILRELGRPVTDADVRKMIRKVDDDDSGKVEFGEFAWLMAHASSVRAQDMELKAAFACMTGHLHDVDESGYPRTPRPSATLSLEALRSWLCETGDKLTDAEFRDMTRDLGVSEGSAEIDYHTFKQLPCWRDLYEDELHPDTSQHPE